MKFFLGLIILILVMIMLLNSIAKLFIFLFIRVDLTLFEIWRALGTFGSVKMY